MDSWDKYEIYIKTYWNNKTSPRTYKKLVLNKHPQWEVILVALPHDLNKESTTSWAQEQHKLCPREKLEWQELWPIIVGGVYRWRSMVGTSQVADYATTAGRMQSELPTWSEKQCWNVFWPWVWTHQSSTEIPGKPPIAKSWWGKGQPPGSQHLPGPQGETRSPGAPAPSSSASSLTSSLVRWLNPLPGRLRSVRGQPVENIGSTIGTTTEGSGAKSKHSFDMSTFYNLVWFSLLQAMNARFREAHGTGTCETWSLSCNHLAFIQNVQSNPTFGLASDTSIVN